MSAGALKRRSLFHGQRKRQKKTATGRTMAENLIRKQLKLTFLVIQTKRGKNSTRRSRRRRSQGERRGSSDCGEGASQLLWQCKWKVFAQLKWSVSQQPACVSCAQVAEPLFGLKLTRSECNLFVLLMKATRATRTRANRERNDVQSWWWSWSRSPSPYSCSS